MKFDKSSIQARIENTLMHTLHISYIETDEADMLEAIMPVTPLVSQTMQVLHGGATIALAESVAGLGSNLLCASDEQCFGMQISASHISSAVIGDTVRAKGTIQHKGSSTHVWNIDVFSETTGRLISSIRITNAVVKKRIYVGKQ